MIPHGNLWPNFCTSWPILFLLKDALLDEHLSHLSQKEIKDYTGKLYRVGKDGPALESPDDICAKFCLKNDCDFITTDKRAFDKIFKLKEIKSIGIKQILERELTIDRPVYSLNFRTE